MTSRVPGQQREFAGRAASSRQDGDVVSRVEKLGLVDDVGGRHLRISYVYTDKSLYTQR